MTRFISRRTALGATGAAATLAIAMPRRSLAQTTHEVQMLNIHPEDKKLRMVFYPRIVVAQPGDSVHFISVDPGHNARSHEDMLPEGAEEFESGISKDLTITVEKPGFYGVICTPHYTLGMIGLIIVEGDGMMDNYETAKAVKHRAKGQVAFDEVWQEVAGMGYTS